jgi:tetratricopeptide (TPR) repeat protein
LVGDDSDQLLDTRAGLATAFNLQDKFAEAEKLLRDSITLGQKKLRPDHPYVANDMYRLAFLLKREGKLDEAETLARECVDNRRRILGVDHPLFDQALHMLALVLDQEGKEKDAAEVLREQLAIRRKHFGDKDSRVASTVINLAGVLTASQDEVQFQELAREFPRAWLTRSEHSAQRGRWSDALAASSEYLKIQPGDHEGYHCTAPLLVQTGQRAKYEELCESITTRFAGATNPYTADRMAKDSLILPRPGVDLKVPAELAETAVTLGRSDSGALPYFECCKALAEYRQGHWDGAADWARRATHNASPVCRGEAYAILSMSQYQLKQTDDSRGALKKCAEIVETQLPKLEAEILGPDWRDLIIVHALQSEAKRMIDGDPSAAARPANTPQ